MKYKSFQKYIDITIHYLLKGAYFFGTLCKFNHILFPRAIKLVLKSLHYLNQELVYYYIYYHIQ